MFFMRIICAVAMLASATGASRGGAWPASVDASLGPKVSALCSVGHMLAFAGGVAPRMPGQRAMSCRWPALRTAAGSTACWALAPRRSGRNAMGLCMAADGGRSGSRSSGSWGPGARGEGEMFGGADDNTWEDLKKVFVLLFNPRTEKEGIYTLQIKRRDGRLVNTIVMFEEIEDAERYSGLLEAQDFPAPSVEVIEPSEIKGFASGAGYQTSFIPKGTLFMPPEENIASQDMDWQLDDSKSKQPSSATSRYSAEPAEVSEEINAVRKKLERLYGGGAA